MRVSHTLKFQYLYLYNFSLSTALMNNLELTIKNGLVVFVQVKGNLWPITLYLKFLLVILVNDL